MGCVLDGIVTPPEECDDGNAINGDGCDADCTISCNDPAVDCPAAPACQKAVCALNHTCATQGDPAAEGTSCGPNDLCKQGVCAPIACGDGVVEGAEQCDFGAGNGPNKGCEATCQFSCGKSPDTCPDMNTCNGVEVCTTVVVGGATGQACLAGQAMPTCSACAGGFCSGGACAASACGDGCIDAANGEQCEPPGTATCNALCKTPACGNAVREGTEQCDDGNTQNLDGCDAACAFEQDHRTNSMVLQFTTDAFCSANKFGAAIAPIAQANVQQALSNGVAKGTSGFLFKFLGLDTLSGSVDDLMLELGVVTAIPIMDAAYNGSNDLDWWYFVNQASLDATRTPLDKLPGSITASVLTAGPGSMNITMNLFGEQATLFRVSSAKLSVGIGATSIPLSSAGTPPGHLASEHLDATLVSFATMGSATPGRLCSNLSAKSLSQSPVPLNLQPGGVFACSEGYTSTHTLLDLMVAGCTIPFAGAVVLPSQPDQVDPGMPAAGGGGPYVFQVSAQKKVTGCVDKNNQPAVLSACLNAAAYSSYLQFTTDRVILK
jgi:cysteine-rich repeat protein